MQWNDIKKIQKNILSQYYYSRLRNPKHWGWLPFDEKELVESLHQFGIPIEDSTISIDEYRDYFEKAGYATRYPKYYGWNLTEKSLEHFVAQQILQLNSTDFYIDIASEGFACSGNLSSTIWLYDLRTGFII